MWNREKNDAETGLKPDPQPEAPYTSGSPLATSSFEKTVEQKNSKKQSERFFQDKQILKKT